MKKILRVLKLLILFTLPWEMVAVAQDNNGKQLWVDVNPQWFNEKNLKISGTLSAQKKFDSVEWNRYYIRPTMDYSLGEGFSLKGGLYLSYTDYKIEEVTPIDDLFEVRPFQEVAYRHPLAGVSLDYYVRVEERFVYDTQTWKDSNSVRLRLQARASYKFDAYEHGRYWKVLLGAELFKTVDGDNLGEKSRITLGVERSYKYEQKIRMEVTWQKQSRLISSDNSISDVYFRFRYYPSWGAIKLNRLKDSL